MCVYVDCVPFCYYQTPDVRQDWYSSVLIVTYIQKVGNIKSSEP